ncbi:hypothetical protein ACFLTE_01860 [Bacteroidota bacterium]
MKLVKITYVFFFFLFIKTSVAQDPFFSLGHWKHTSLSGELNIKGLYREQENLLRTDQLEFQKSAYLLGGIDLKSKSYFWHPNFLILDINTVYNPETRQEEFLVIPDRSEARTIQKLNIGATFLNQKIISLYTFVNFDQNYINYENLSNVKSKSQSYGGNFSFNNKILPLSFYYNQRKWDQKEILTGRTFNFDQNTFQSRASKSFFSKDKHEIKYTRNEYFRQDANLFQTRNTIDKIDLTNNIYFDKKKNYNFNSRISNMNREGFSDFTRFQVNERLNFKFPKKFNFSSYYIYSDIRQEMQNQKQQLLNGMLKHKLYESLETILNVEYNTINHTSFQETNNKSGIHLKYTKKIPLNGRLKLSYRYLNHNRNMENDPTGLQILNEEYVLNDDIITLLNSANVNIETVLVKDETGTTIYQENLDYVLIERNEYLEIQRFPGGQIPNGATVYIDYITTMEGSYHYDAINRNFNVGVSLFNQMIEVYYKNTINDYKDLDITDLVILNYITQNIYGSRVKISFVSCGIEYSDYNSSILPYKLIRYYLHLQKRFGEKFLISLNGNIRDYNFTRNDRSQIFSDLSGKIAYQINYSTKINFDAGYRKQKGEQIDLDLITTRGEITKIYRKIFLSIGLETYHRNYLDEIINFKGGYFQITRKF